MAHNAIDLKQHRDLSSLPHCATYTYEYISTTFNLTAPLTVPIQCREHYRNIIVLLNCKLFNSNKVLLDKQQRCDKTDTYRDQGRLVCVLLCMCVRLFVPYTYLHIKGPLRVYRIHFIKYIKIEQCTIYPDTHTHSECHVLNFIELITKQRT